MEIFQSKNIIPLRFPVFTHRGHTHTAVTGEHGGNALSQQTLRIRILDNAQVGVGMHINEAGAYTFASGVYHSLGLHSVQFANFYNDTISNGYIRRIRRSACAVV